MKKPQFRLRTLLLLTAILAVVFAVCAQWPVKEFVYRSINEPSGAIYLMTSLIERPPTIQEWLIRVGISVVAIVISIPLVVVFYRGVRISLPIVRTTEKDRSK